MRQLMAIIKTAQDHFQFVGDQAGYAIQAVQNKTAIEATGTDGDNNEGRYVIPYESVLYADWAYREDDSALPVDDNCKGGDEPEPSPEPTPEPGTFTLKNAFTDYPDPYILYVVADSEITGQYGDLEFVNNNGTYVATVELENGQTLNATGLPDGLGLTIWDDGDNQVWAGTVPTTYTLAPLLVKFPSSEITIQITLDDPTINGIHGYFEFENGVSTKTSQYDMGYVYDLPIGTGFTITGESPEDVITGTTPAYVELGGK